MNRLIEIFNAALAAVDPCTAVLKSVHVEENLLHVGDSSYELGSFDKIYVIGAGKATARMAQAIEVLMGGRISSGLIIVKDGHSLPLNIIEQVESSHPVPGTAGMAATQRILCMAQDAGDKTLVICLLSGGASALLVAPVKGITLQDKQETTRLLLNAGASINELNAVRKHLSLVKGGKLACAAYPAQLLTLAISDVVGDLSDVIGSGPTVADASTFLDAWSVLEKYGLQYQIPPCVAEYLWQGIHGAVTETIKSSDSCLEASHYTVIANLGQAALAAREQAESLGISSRVIKLDWQGEAREVARILSQQAQDELIQMYSGEWRCLISGGETTVTVRGKGKGGRNQELALAFALEIEGLQGMTLLSAGTDGTDGPNDAAGAVVNGQTVSKARGLGLQAEHYLDENDSYTFFRQLDNLTGSHCHFKPGATGTNVMDLQMILLHKN